MPDQAPPPPPEEERPPAKDKVVVVRIEEDVYKRALERARLFGGLSTVVRAFLRLFADGESALTPDDVKESNKRAAKRPRKAKPETPPPPKPAPPPAKPKPSTKPKPKK